MVADTCLPSQNPNFISVLFCYAKTPFLQALELHAACSSHRFLISLHIQALEQFMPLFVYGDKVGRKGKTDMDVHMHHCACGMKHS